MARSRGCINETVALLSASRSAVTLTVAPTGDASARGADRTKIQPATDAELDGVAAHAKPGEPPGLPGENPPSSRSRLEGT
jgi:hypothetical protein